ncbi:MAG: hypothetical protein OHK0039_16120 [Bacteroidia bacterium]
MEKERIAPFDFDIEAAGVVFAQAQVAHEQERVPAGCDRACGLLGRGQGAQGGQEQERK